MDYPGAAYLAADAGISSGAGLVFLATPFSLPSIPEVIPLNLKEKSDYFNMDHFSEIDFDFYDAIVLGCGLSQASEEFVLSVIKGTKKPIVVDADALNILLRLKEPLNLDHCILTPHPGEAGKLLGISVEEVQNNRFESLEKMYEKYKASIILKGAGTLVASNNNFYINPTGNPYLATAGSGDVLAGICGSFLAQKKKEKDLSQVIISAVFVHGLSGNLGAVQNSGIIKASDITSQISKAINYTNVNLPEDLSDRAFLSDTINFCWQ